WLDFAPRVRDAFHAGEHHVDGHPHVHGANLGVAAHAYRAVGGFPPLPAQEDRALRDALDRAGFAVARHAQPAVTTSARRAARARQGFGAYLPSLETAASSPGLRPLPATSSTSSPAGGGGAGRLARRGEGRCRPFAPATGPRPVRRARGPGRTLAAGATGARGRHVAQHLRLPRSSRATSADQVLHRRLGRAAACLRQCGSSKALAAVLGFAGHGRAVEGVPEAVRGVAEGMDAGGKLAPTRARPRPWNSSNARSWPGWGSPTPIPCRTRPAAGTDHRRRPKDRETRAGRPSFCDAAGATFRHPQGKTA